MMRRGRPSQKPLVQLAIVREIEELRAALGLSIPEMAQRLGVKRQSLWGVLYGAVRPGPRYELALRLLRTELRDDAERLRQQADRLAGLSR